MSDQLMICEAATDRRCTAPCGGLPCTPHKARWGCNHFRCIVVKGSLKCVPDQLKSRTKGQDMPKRIQRKRTKGWRMPANTVYVGRPSKWQNWIKVGGSIQHAMSVNVAVMSGVDDPVGYRANRPVTAEDAAKVFRYYATNYPQIFPPFEDLRGKDLACWCPLDQPCHADVLLELANQELANQEEAPTNG